MSDQSIPMDAVGSAFREGRRIGLATGALALSAVSFINLLGLEKSILAAILAIFALRGITTTGAVIRRGRAALLIAAVQAATVITVLLIFHEKLLQLIQLLQKLG